MKIVTHKSTVMEHMIIMNW